MEALKKSNTLVNTKYIQLFINTGSKTHCITVREDAYVHTLKDIIKNKIGIEQDNFYLLYGGKNLEFIMYNEKINNINICDNSTIILNFRPNSKLVKHEVSCSKWHEMSEIEKYNYQTDYLGYYDPKLSVHSMLNE